MENRDGKREHDEPQTDLADPLGIAGAPVTPDAPDHLRASDDDEEARKRRQRGLSADNDAPRVPTADINTDHKGATGIDMGSGGSGTNVSDRGSKP